MRHLATLLLVLTTAPTAVAGLALEIEIESTEIDFEATVTYVVRFVNRGTEEVRYYEPLLVGEFCLQCHGVPDGLAVLKT